MKTYRKITNLKSFKNERRAEKYLEKVKRGFKINPGLQIFKLARKKDDSSIYRVGYVSRLGRKSNGAVQPT